MDVVLLTVARKNHDGGSEMADTIWNRVLRVWGTLCYSGRTLRNRPILRDRWCLLFPNHRSEGAVGRLGLRVHRVRNLLFPGCTFGFNASADKADQTRAPDQDKARIKKSIPHSLGC